ncbi:MAG: hypothetical protein ACQERC_06865 [Bacteroidota bacterium]
MERLNCERRFLGSAGELWNRGNLNRGTAEGRTVECRTVELLNVECRNVEPWESEVRSGMIKDYTISF